MLFRSERFRNEITQGIQPDYYDRDELLDIYDYAQDEADVMVQMYVFLVASRLYPDADSFLGERIGFFVSYLDSRAGMDLLQRKGRPDTPLWDVLALGVKHYPQGDPASDLEAFFKKHKRIDSESVIKLVDLLREMERPDLLHAHLTDLRKAVEDPQGLLFEAAESLRNAGEPYLDTARDLAEELTEKEPFNIDNWVLLSKIQFQRQDAEEAVSAADYAAALDPSFRPPKIMKALGMVVTGENRPEAIETLRNLMHEQPDDTVAMRGLIEALRQEGRKDEAVDECLRMLSADATSLPSILPQILSMGMTDRQADIVATLIYDSFGDDEARYIEIARGLMQQNLGSGAAFILERFDLRYGICIGAELMIEVYYRLRRHEDLIAFFKKCCDRNRNPDGSGQSAVPSGSCGESESAGITSRMPLQLSSASILFFASASLLAGDYATAALVSEMAIATAYSNFDELDIYDRISYKGMLNIMRDINRYAANPSTIPSTPDFDPITDRERI